MADTSKVTYVVDRRLNDLEDYIAELEVRLRQKCGIITHQNDYIESLEAELSSYQRLLRQ